jgi:hypothetical protein
MKKVWEMGRWIEKEMVIAEAGNQAATAPENGAQMDNR